MSINQNDKELIERYLDEGMTSEEMMSFEKRLNADSELLDELTMQKMAIQALRKNESIKSELREIFGEVKSEQITPKSNRSFYWAAAAVLLIVSVFSIYYFSGTKDYNDIYLSYYHPLAATDVTRNEGAVANDTELSKAMDLYRQGEYTLAGQKFETLTSSDNSIDKWWVYLANCYMNTGELSKAREALERAFQTESNFTKQQAQWYLSLLNLKEGHIAQARIDFEKIYSGGGVYERHAKSILDEMD